VCVSASVYVCACVCVSAWIGWCQCVYCILREYVRVLCPCRTFCGCLCGELVVVCACCGCVFCLLHVLLGCRLGD